MHPSWFWLPLSLLGAVSRSVAGAIPAIAPSTAADSSLISLSGLSDEAEIPYGFSVNALYNRYTINPLHTVAVCMLAMGELALQDFNDDLPPGPRSWRNPRYPDVILRIEPSEGDRVVAARYALWTIFLVFKDMLIRNVWQDSKSIGDFRGKFVATLDLLPVLKLDAVSEGLTMIQEPGSLNDGAAAAAAVQKPDDFAFSLNSSQPGSIDNGTLKDDECYAHIEYLPKAVNHRDIIAAVCMLLVNSFPHNRELLQFAKVRIKGPTVNEVSSAWNSVRPPPPPPMRMTRGDFIVFLSKLPEHLYLQQKWFEMNVALSERGVAVANGFFRTKP
ncbi:MAG: hypothetical protein LQ352_004579 [Teloschistes flavicans]|nr:MAG: hypothetical protein LQ352_004579 [Teloschistes flavicans]